MVKAVEYLLKLVHLNIWNMFCILCFSWFFTSVHFRIRVIDQHRPKSLSPSTSGITYWQIEAEHSILDGNDTIVGSIYCL